MVLAGAAALAAPRCSASAPEVMPNPESGRGLAYGPPKPVALAAVPKGSPPEATKEAVRQAAEAVTDFAWLQPGDTVLIKPACNSGNPYPATTDPLALSAMISLLKERGAGRVIVGDMSGVQAVRFTPDSLSGSTRELMIESGMAAAIEEAGGEVHAFEEAGWGGFYEERAPEGGHWKGPIMMPNVAREADHIVLMPRTSRHVLLGSTNALKCAVGWWRHDTRLEYHHDAASIQEKTAEANWIPTLLEKQRLVLTSATKLLAAFGPDKGTIIEPATGIVFASTDTVAHDMVSLACLLGTRAGMPEDERDGLFADPHGSGFVVDSANRIVNYWLDGVGKALSAETLVRNDWSAIWDDRVLSRAFVLAGGVPQVEWRTVGTQPATDTLAALEPWIRLPVG